MSKDAEARKKRAELVKDLDISGRFKRYHTPSGVHRILAGGSVPLDRDPDDEMGTVNRLRPKRGPANKREVNLKERHKKPG